MTSLVNFGSAQTGVSYQCFGTSGSLAAKITSGINNPDVGVYMSTFTPTTGTVFVQWTCDNTALIGNDYDLILTGVVDSVTNGVTVTTNSDKTGYTLVTTPPTAAVIASTILDTVLTGHTTSDTAGKALKIISAFVSNKKTIIGDILTIYDVDGTTALCTLTLSPSGGPYTGQA